MMRSGKRPPEKPDLSNRLVREVCDDAATVCDECVLLAEGISAALPSGQAGEPHRPALLAVREQLRAVCRAMGVSTETQCGPDKVRVGSED
jgi:hypothetical protein